MRYLSLIFTIFFFSTPAFAEDAAEFDPVTPTPSIEVPQDIAAIIPAGYGLIEFERGDLNGDGLQDYLAVVEKKTSDFMDVEQRPLLVITARKDGSFKLAARGDKVVFCSTCGGVMGDPFTGLEVKRNRFTVHMYGGSNWRWAYDYTFAYSVRDDAWQLVESVETNHHMTSPDEEEVSTYKPPKDFGKINLQDFDPDAYLPSRK